MALATLDYIHVSYSEPHAARGRAILAAHPELRALAGNQPSSGWWLFGLVVAQFAVALAVANRSWLIWVPCAYVIGATIDHALWVLIHEATHNLIFRNRTANRIAVLAANLPLVTPGAVSFGKYHLLHHRHLGELEFDAGVPGPLESRVVGQSTVKKTIWVSLFALVQAVRPRRMKQVPLFDGWTIANLVVQVAAMTLLVMWAGAAPLKYLVTATIFAIGLHPLGGRWIQEHFAFAPGQETYSYYGILNKVSFNVGYHVEHHDLITIPWSRLPQIRRIAPEFYEGMHSYHSWTALLVRFIVDQRLSLYNYIVRPSRS